MLTPKPLFSGARVALVGGSGPLPAPERLEPAVAALRAFGFEPVLFPSATERYGYLAGTDERRACDLNAAFADPSIDGILLSRGGYGMARILPLLDWEMIAKNPKFVAGYSDATALLGALNRICSFVAYHMPMPTTELYNGVDAYTLAYVRAMYFGHYPETLTNPDDMPFETLVGGCARGELCGGNLSLVAASVGTPFEVDTAGKILFLEEVHEEPYRIDGMLTQLRNSGKLDACAGILLGAFTDCEPEHTEKSLSLSQIFQDILVPAGKPMLSGLACGHCLPTMSLPMGAQVTLDADAKVIRLR